MSIRILNPYVEFHAKGMRIFEDGKHEEYFILYDLILTTITDTYNHTFYLDNGLKVIVSYDENTKMKSEHLTTMLQRQLQSQSQPKIRSVPCD